MKLRLSLTVFLISGASFAQSKSLLAAFNQREQIGVSKAENACIQKGRTEKILKSGLRIEKTDQVENANYLLLSNRDICAEYIGQSQDGTVYTITCFNSEGVEKMHTQQVMCN